MVPKHRMANHPGEILSNESFMKPLLPCFKYRFMVDGKVIDTNSGITSEDAIVLSNKFGTSPEFWNNLQANYDATKDKGDVDNNE